MTMRASLIIQAQDRASSVFGRIADRARKLGAAFRPVSREAGKAGAALDKAGAKAPSHFARIGAAARKMAGDLRIAERAGKAAGTALGWTAGAVGGFIGGTAAVGITAMTGALGWLSAGVVTTGAKFEQFEAQLEGIEGSAAKARAAMDWVAKFAASTPYEMEEVTDAFVRARNLGIDPMAGAMTSLGDAAAANRKTMIDAVEAMADAQTGEFERLKEFGITSSTKGGTVAFSYIDKAGRQAVKRANKNSKDIQKAILAIWDERHGGAMLRQSKTFVGLWSNLKDAVTGFQVKIARAGIFDRIKDSLADALDWANKLADSGKLDAWAKRISDFMSKAWEKAQDFVKNTDWAQVGRDMIDIASAAWSFAKAIAWAVNTAKTIAGSDMATVRDGPPPPVEPRRPGGDLPWYQPFRLRQESAPPAAPARPKAAPPQKVQAAVDLRISTDPGVKARTTQLAASDGVKVNVANRGAVRPG